MNKFLKNSTSFLFFFVFTAQTLKAQTTITLKFSYYSISEGLGSTNVRKTVQDSMGYIWVATQDGLYRFDGTRFVAFNRSFEQKYALSGNDIRDIFITDNILWAVSSYGGIDAINILTGNVIYRFNQQTVKTLWNVLFLSIAKKGNTLLIGSDKGLFIFDLNHKKINRVTLTDSLKKKIDIKINKLIVDHTGKIWLLTENNGVYVLDSNYKMIDQFKGTSTRYYDCDLLGESILVAGNAGIQQLGLQNGKIIPKPGLSSILSKWQDKDIYALRKDNTGHLWFATKDNLVKLDIEKKTISYIHSQSLKLEKGWLSSVYSIYFDNSNNIWLSCQEGLSFSANMPSEFISYHKSSNSETVIKHAYYLFPYTDSSTIVCAAEGLYNVNMRTRSIIPLDLNNTYYYSFLDINNNLVVSNTAGSFILRKGQLIPFTDFYPEFRKFGKLIINSEVNFHDSLIIFGTQNKKGILLWKYKHKEVTQVSENSPIISIKDNNINTIYRDENETVWILADNSICRYNVRKKEITELPIENPVTKNRYTIFFDICKIKSTYYIASYSNGIIELDKNYHFQKEISLKNGLANNGVYKLLPYKDSLLVATTNNGLSVISLESGLIKNYYEKDGLQSSVFEELSGNTKNNLLYAGGKEGFSLINPALFTKNLVPPTVYINGIEIETPSYRIDSTNLQIHTIDIPNDVTQTIIKFSGLNYSNPEKTIYSYRILEKQGGWVNLGSQNYLQLVGFEPGVYTLQVKAANEDGKWSEIKEIKLTYLPKWFQTLWFKLLVILTVILLLYVFYLYRIRQILKLERVRQKISSDLHDDIGSTLNSVHLITNMAILQPHKKEYLSNISEGLQYAIIGVRDIIWVLDKKPETCESVFKRIASFSEALCTEAGCAIQVYIEPEILQHNLSSEEKRNIYLILKESINNCIKYAECTRITLSAVKRKNDILISIEDNGKGFTIDTITNNPVTSGGNGLKNISLRCNEIKWKLNIVSSIGKGSTIEICGKIKG